MNKKTMVLFSALCLLVLNVSLACAGNEAVRATPQELLERTSKAANVEGKSDAQVAQALNIAGLDLFFVKKRPAEAVVKHDEVVARFGNSSEFKVRTQVARAMGNKAARLGAMNRHQEAITTDNELLAHFGNASEPEIRTWVVSAMINKGVNLTKMNRTQEGFAVFDEVTARFGEAPEPEPREQAAKAMFLKGRTLSELNRTQEAIAVYDELIARFGKVSEPGMQDTGRLVGMRSVVSLAENAKAALQMKR